ncbi:MAG TPA: PIN domain-containing protein [Candidatus Limnocylindrales bacterium]|nr:PIN domain-containing protein [Candidatus Limnocylindrales bacterium]
MGRIKTDIGKPLAVVDSNIIIYAMTIDAREKRSHEACLNLIDRGFKGQLDYILALNDLIVVEVFSALRKLLSPVEAESRVSLLLRSRRIAYLSISSEECEVAIKWAKIKNVPVNDALIAANTARHAELIFTADEEHFRHLEEFGVKLVNPLKK